MSTGIILLQTNFTRKLVLIGVHLFVCLKSQALKPKDKAVCKLDLTACKQSKLIRQAYWQFQQHIKQQIYWHEVRPKSLDIRSRVAPTVGIKCKQVKLTVQTKWNWSIKSFIIISQYLDLHSFLSTPVEREKRKKFFLSLSHKKVFAF